MAIDTTSDNLNPLGFFWANNPNVNQQLRQRLAMQMMSQRKGHPKNIGEGLSAIGDSIGDLGMARRLEQADLAQQGAARGRAGLGGGAAPVGYAPPDQVEPAVSAIERAINPEAAAAPDTAPAPDMLTAPPPAQPASMLAPTMPSDLGGDAPAPTPQQAGSLMSPQPTIGPPPAQGAAEGGYNMLDAQADMGRTPGPGYVQDAIQGATQDPDMQAYLSQLVKKEAPNGPRDTSSTGAAGPYQFTRGTGERYGLNGSGVPDQRENLGASTAAALKLTQDNAAIFAKINGRPPTMAELALMHQQGGGTGSRMVAGTGNASPNNLAVNNINPQANPAQAVAGIKRYYGMPDRAVDPRAGIASILAQRSGVPQANPTDAPASPDGGPPVRLAFNGTPGPVQSDISRAPPFPQIRQAPPQAPQGAPDPGYVTAPPRTPIPPPQIPPSQKEMQLIFDAQNNPYLAPLAAQETAKRTFQQNQLEEAYKLQVKQYEELTKMSEEQKTTQAKRRQEYEITGGKAPLEQSEMRQRITKEAQQQADQERFGQDPKSFFTQMDKDKAAAQTAASVVEANKLALSAIRGGVITGWGANKRIDLARLQAWAFNNGLKGDAAANTQIMEAAFKNAVGQAVQTIQGGPGSKASDTDVKIATAASGGDPNLEIGAVQALLGRANKAATMTLNDYEHRKDYYLHGHAAEQQYNVPVSPTAEEKYLKTLLQHSDSAEQRANFDKRFGEGSAELEIARAKRQAMRGGSR